MSAKVLHFVAVENAPNRIRELRMAAGMSQQSLGDRIGRSKMTISDLERGEIKLDLEYMELIADALNVQPAELLPRRLQPDLLASDERQLIERYRAANEVQREQIHRMADVIVPFGHAPRDAA